MSSLQNLSKFEKLISETEKNPILFFRFFDVFGTVKRRRRLEFWQHVVLDVPEHPASLKIWQNEFFLTNFRKNFRDRRLGGMRGA